MQVTYQCNIACKHCGPYCAPDQKEWMTLPEMKDLIQQASELGVRNVVFTGGEPSLLGDDLPVLLHYLHDELGIPFSRIVTNGKFATSYDKAHRIFKKWRDAGLAEVNISCGEFHPGVRSGGGGGQRLSSRSGRGFHDCLAGR
jgi:MoaA/NifB/PqqE/SkfB family radical SAM enzyme